MGLDISFTQRKKMVCPECGKTIGHTDVRSASSGGRVWYDFLELIGYYVPYDKRTEENDWYGKDRVLTAEQAKYVYRFAQEENVYNEFDIVGLIATAMFEHDDIVINANW